MVRRSVARSLAVVLHDLAWLLPRTIDVPAAEQDPMPPSQLEVMRLLIRRPGLRVREVAAELGLQASNTSLTARSLEERGLVRREGDDDDSRAVRLHPTDEALAARERREQSWAAELQSMLGGLSTEDRAALAAATGPLQRLAAALTTELR